MATTRHRSLVERGGREAFVIDKGLPHKKEQEKKYQDIHDSKEKYPST